MNEVTVYDLNGQPHAMSTLNAWDMVKHMGWTRETPATEGAEQDGQPAAPAAQAPASEAPQTLADGASATMESTIPSEEKKPADVTVDFDVMSKEQLIEWAKTTYADIEIDARWGKPRILAAIGEVAAKVSAP